MVLMPCSMTPAGPFTSGQYDATTRPPLELRRGLPRSQFRGSITRLRHSLSTLRRTDHSATTQDSLLAAGQALPDGIGYPQGSNERFQSHLQHLIPLSQTSWRKVRLVLPDVVMFECVWSPAFGRGEIAPKIVQIAQIPQGSDAANGLVGPAGRLTCSTGMGRCGNGDRGLTSAERRGVGHVRTSLAGPRS